MARSSEPPDTKSDRARTNPVQVLAKAGSVLDALGERGELSPAELSQQIGEPRSSVYRLLSSLIELGFVVPGVRRGTVQLGIKLYRLGCSAIRSRDVRAAALDPMLELREKTGATVFLGIRSGYRVLCLERIEGEWLVNNALLPGTNGPLHVGAIGPALLAAEPPEFWQEYAEKVSLETFTKNTISNLGQLERAMREIQATGASISDEDRLPGMAGVGAPIRDHDDTVCAAISFSGLRPSVLGDHQAESLDLVRAAATEISAGLRTQRDQALESVTAAD